MTFQPEPRVAAAAVLLAGHLALLIMFSVAADDAGSWATAPIAAAATGCVAMVAVLTANLTATGRLMSLAAGQALAAAALWLCATGTVVLFVAGTVAMLTARNSAQANDTVVPIALAAMALAFGLVPTAATRRALRPAARLR
jgi:hypothetical protein